MLLWSWFIPGADAPDIQTGRAGRLLSDRIAVLLATLNGARFLEAQLKSLADQSVDGIDIYASDDGSTDATRAILQSWASQWTKGRFEVIQGPRAGFAENFRSLLIRDGVDADFVAFCDQDDMWDIDKLERSRTALREFGHDQPALYCGRTRIIDADGIPKGQSPLMTKPPSFRNALVQSIAGGNTMVLNRPAFDLVRQSAVRTGFVSHDWWCYLIVSGVGGRVVYDREPAVSYRQHSNNMIGANTGWPARVRRIKMMLRARFAKWNTINGKALVACRDLLTDDARAVVDAFVSARKGGRVALLQTLARHSIHRQTAVGGVTLYLAAALRRV